MKCNWNSHITNAIFLMMLCNSSIPVQLNHGLSANFSISEYDFITHTPIVISSNLDLEILNFSGSGVEYDPYVIENLNITVEGDCITISNTDKYIEIRNCLLSSPSGLPHSDDLGHGLYMFNISRVTVINCTISEKTQGIFSIFASNCIIKNNTLDECRIGISIGLSMNCVLINNSLSTNSHEITISYSHSCTMIGNSVNSIRLEWSTNCSLSRNALGSRGVIISGPHEISYWRHHFTDNVVNGIPLGYFCDIFGQSINGEQYSQLIIVNCTQLSIDGGSFQDRYIGLQMVYSSSCTIANITSNNNSMDGVQFILNDACIITSSIFQDNALSGIYMSSSVNCWLSDNSLTGSHYGILIQNDENCTIIDNSILSNSVSGLQMEYIANANILGNIIGNNSQCGVEIVASQSCNIESNFEFGSSNGIHIHDSTDSEVDSNSVLENSYGIWIDDSTDIVIKNNRVYNNSAGLFLTSSDGLIILRNFISDNGFGVFINQDSSNNSLYANGLGPNSVSNARDNGIDNKWDNCNNLGNIWSDFDGSVPYPISGIAGAIDRYPEKFTDDPDLDNLSNVEELKLGTDPHNNDSDLDKMPDGWEIQYTLNPLMDDANLDADLDTLSNLVEYHIGTSPIDDDSDDDSFKDGWEVYWGFDPLSSEVPFLEYVIYNLAGIAVLSGIVVSITLFYLILRQYRYRIENNLKRNRLVDNFFTNCN